MPFSVKNTYWTMKPKIESGQVPHTSNRMVCNHQPCYSTTIKKWKIVVKPLNCIKCRIFYNIVKKWPLKWEKPYVRYFYVGRFNFTLLFQRNQVRSIHFHAHVRIVQLWLTTWILHRTHAHTFWKNLLNTPRILRYAHQHSIDAWHALK